MNKFLILIITLLVSLSACSNDTSSSSSSSDVGIINISVVPSLFVASGADVQVIYVLTPTNASNQNVSFSSSDNSVATVDDNGTVTGVSYGKAIINVESNDGSNIRRVVYVNVENAVDDKCSTSVDGFEVVNGDYHIYNATGLHAFRDEVNAGNYTANAKLRCNIQLAPSEPWDTIAPYIQSEGIGYKGTFDGDNYTISGLYMYHDPNNGLGTNSFFSAINATGVVKNVTFDNPFLVDAHNSGVVTDINFGLIDNVSVINGVVVADSSAGGIANVNEGIISSCYNSSEIKFIGTSSSANVFGGITAINRGKIIASYNVGTIFAESREESETGGIAGSNNGEIIASYNSGEINSFSFAGGIVGRNSINNVAGSVIASYNVGQLNLDNADAGGIIGNNERIYIGSLITGNVSSSYYLQSSATKGIADAIGGDIVGTTDNVSTIGGFVNSRVIDALNNSISNIYNYQYVRNEFEDVATRPLIVIAK